MNIAPLQPQTGTAPPRHFLDLAEMDSGTLRAILDDARSMKSAREIAGSTAPKPLDQKVVALIFDKPSTRTRVSFEVGIHELGGKTIMLTGAEMQLGRGETIADTARVLSRYVDAIVIRILSHEDLLELAAHASVPVINGLTKFSHPCQLMADVLTFEEHCGSIQGKKIAWLGDFNNVLLSWIHAANKFDFSIHVATPNELAVPSSVMDWATKTSTRLHVSNDPAEAAADADAIVTDCWVSMGDEEEEAKRRTLLAPYQVNAKMMALADPNAIFMHCLPAHRGEEVTDDVIDGRQSVVFDEAENRLHAQKSILNWALQFNPGEPALRP